MINYHKLLSILFLLFFSPVFIFGQGQGRIEGNVTDSKGEALVGANIILEGTSLGASTDLEGTYVINGVPVGEYTLIVNYIGYERVETTVNVAAAQTVEFNATLRPESVKGQEVVVSAQARGQRQAINEQLTAETIKNVVSAERIRELPDEDAATALSRLPGVSLQEGDKVVVRGIQAKMNTVLVNGIQLPSTDVSDRSTNLGFISSNMLSGIEVTKAVTPAMDANAIGGVVNLKLREAPSDFHFDVLSQGSFNTQDRTYQNYEVWASASNRFFNDNLGAFLQFNAMRTDGGVDIGNAEYTRQGIGADAGYGEATYGIELFEYLDNVQVTEERGGSLMLDYDLPNGTLVMQNTYAYTHNDSTRHIDRMRFNAERGREFRIDRDIHSKNLIINALQGRHSIVGSDLEVDWGLSHALSEKETDLNYFITFLNGSPQQPAFTGADSETERLRWNPDSVYGMELNPEYARGATVKQNGARVDEAFTERMLTGNLNFTLPITLTNSISGRLKAGGKIDHRERENDIERYFARLTEPENNQGAADYLEGIGQNPNEALQFENFKDYDYLDERGQYYLGGEFDMRNVVNTNYMDNYFRMAPSEWPAGRHIPDSRRDDWEGSETITAGYLMADMRIGPRLSVMTGLRYENFRMDYDANFTVQTHFDGDGYVIPDSTLAERTPAIQTDKTRTIDHWFPNLQLRYAFTEWMDARFAYTKTLSRPDYDAIIPEIFYDQGVTGAAGNPLLNPSVANNYDLSLSVYNNSVGLFTAGAYYKRIDEFFFSDDIMYQNLPENIVYPTEAQFDSLGLQPLNPDGTVTTYLNNPNPAYLQGLELEWQTHFWYLPRPLNYLVMNINYTRTFSEMDYRQIRQTQVDTIINGRPRKISVQVDTFRTARLLYQSDHLLNLTLGADYKGFSGRLSFRLQGDVITEVGSRPEEDQFTGNIYNFDLTIRQRLPIQGLSLFLNGKNLAHFPQKDYQSFKRGEDMAVERNLSTTIYNPREIELGLRYSY